MSGIHPSYADCTIVAIEFRRGEPTMVRMACRGEELLVVAGLALVGDALREIRNLETLAKAAPVPLRRVK